MARNEYPGQGGLMAPSDDFEAVTPDDDVDLERLPKYLQIGATGGALVMHNGSGETVTFEVEAGQVVMVRPHRILETTVAEVIAVY